MKTSMAITPAPLRHVPFLFAGRIDDGIRCAADLGYEAVELHLRDPLDPATPAILRSVKSAGLTVSSIGTGQGFTVDRLSISSTDPNIVRATIARLAAHLNAASEFGAVVIVGSMQGRLSDIPAQRRMEEDATVSLLRQLGDEATRLGVRVAIEPLNRYETNFLNTVTQANQLLDRVDHPAFGILLDTFHMNIEEASMDAAVRSAGARLSLVHLADSNRGPAGSGHLDFVSLLDAMRATRYSGFLSAEILPMGDDRRAAEKSLQTMRALIDRGSGRT